MVKVIRPSLWDDGESERGLLSERIEYGGANDRFASADPVDDEELDDWDDDDPDDVEEDDEDVDDFDDEEDLDDDLGDDEDDFD
jgi:hypothetical protein